MASNGHYRPRNRTLILAAAITFILSAIFLTYMRVDPLPLTMSDIDGETMATGKSKHDKGGQTYPQVSALPASHLPTNTRRLMVIGDVHGHLKSLEALLRKAEFSAARGDTVIFAGDMVNKGPDSAGVIELAMKIGAFGVRGNHEDRVLRAWEYLEAKRRAKGEQIDSNSNSDDDDDEEEEETKIITDAKDTGEEESEEIQNSGSEEGSEGEQEEEDDSQSTSHDKKHKKKKGKKDKKKKKKKGHKHKPHHRDIVTAKSLKPKHRAWLSRLPLILRIGDLGPRYGEVLVVHAGLVPGVPLESQDPEAVMTMRTILLPSLSDASHPLFDSSPHDDQLPLTTTTQTEDQPTHTELKESKNKHHHPPKMIPSASRKGIPWAEVWTSYQQAYFSPPSLPSSPSSQLLLPIRPATVVYGHDAKAGLKMRRYAFGVDSGCGNGERLTGVIFEFGGQHDRSNGIMNEEGVEENENGNDGGNGTDINEAGEAGDQGHKARIRHRLVSVSCAEGH
ncbi:Metallo-dependent phosphatase [Xylaria scruposa]|nr:Metallo-dependent phosphatase [Xylaria scruposa]